MRTHYWENKEANFGKPLKNEVKGGAHVTLEIILKKDGKYVLLRRPKGIPRHRNPGYSRSYPNGFLYFCHDLIRYGESVEKCVRRIVRNQAGVGVKSLKIIYIESVVRGDNWAIIPHVIAEISALPKKSRDVSEVVVFGRNNVPEGLAWWSSKDLKEFLRGYNGR